MIDEDLSNLRIFLQRMDQKVPVQIGSFTCCAHEILSIVEDAMHKRGLQSFESVRVKMLSNGRWVVIRQDGSNADMTEQTFSTLAAVKNYLADMRRS